jgi:uncharacterized membrane protein YgdD (TMEM256/DUF423 family)
MALAVVAGAFGAHALQAMLDERYRLTYHTAVTYHVYHAMAIIITGALSSAANKTFIKIAFRCFISGLILFCGSLYMLTLLIAFANIRYSWLGAITPFGGVLFIAGWVMLALAVKKEK